jgi:hypothetical protein
VRTNAIVEPHIIPEQCGPVFKKVRTAKSTVLVPSVTLC